MSLLAPSETSRGRSASRGRSPAPPPDSSPDLDRIGVPRQHRMNPQEEELIRRSDLDDENDMLTVRYEKLVVQKSIVDPRLQEKEPIPHIGRLFPEFNRMFFQGKLPKSIRVKWAKNMKSDCGQWIYDKDHPTRPGLIALSWPILRFRTRKEIVEQILHEMIHAYVELVSLEKNPDDDHGDVFQRHMNRINKEAGTNITVYHSNYDEVERHKKYSWRCDGPCRDIGPHFGWVVRAHNEAPSRREGWFKVHAEKCGGEFVAEHDSGNNSSESEDEESTSSSGSESSDEDSENEESGSESGSESDDEESGSATSEETGSDDDSDQEGSKGAKARALRKKFLKQMEDFWGY